MKEKLYTIPVNEAFENNSECPICNLRKKLETDAIEYTMGPSYMEDDIREETSRLGFCEKHLEQLYKHQNRLGLALIMKTHMDKLVKEVEKHSKSGIKFSSPALFKKRETPKVIEYLEGLEHNCFVCNKMEATFDRYLVTVFYLYHNDDNFRKKFEESKGFCTGHYKSLYLLAPDQLKGEELKHFITELNKLYLDNMKRVRDDLEWFINKFDYRYADQPWNNAKDALPRSMQKTNSII